MALVSLDATTITLYIIDRIKGRTIRKVMGGGGPKYQKKINEN